MDVPGAPMVAWYRETPSNPDLRDRMERSAS